MSLASRSQVKITALVYSPYGHIGSQAGRATIIGFKDELFDPLLGTYALGRGYRSYSPALMRFLKPDDLSPFSDGGYNAYAYCACDPINYRDDTGQQREFANLQKFWEQKSNPKPQRTAPLTKKACGAGNRAPSVERQALGLTPSGEKKEDCCLSQRHNDQDVPEGTGHPQKQPSQRKTIISHLCKKILRNAQREKKARLRRTFGTFFESLRQNPRDQ